MAVKRTCKCCGREYEYCPNCQKENKPLWMVSFDNETCKELFNLVSAFNLGLIPQDKVQQFVKDNGLNASKYLEPIRKVLEPDWNDYKRKDKRHTGYRFDYKERDIQ